MATVSDILARISSNEEKFKKYNSIRMKNLYRAIAEQSIANVIELIPYLLHVNIADMPGHIPGVAVPHGIYDYVPSSSLVDFLSKRFPGVEIARGRSAAPFIQMAALIGSCGTIAYTKQSDFDFWICYQETKHDREMIGYFKSKLRAIEKWIYDVYNMEIHFYLNEISRVRNNIFADDEEQISGSSIGVILKEEFLRSSIILCGKIPFWWVVPSGSDDRTYALWLKAAMQGGVAERFLDIGNISSVTPEDFLAAALFQILKSLGNPFKSIMKLGLLERYIDNTMENPFICNIIKENIHHDRFAPEQIDAYIIMFNQVYDYFSSIVKDPEALEVLKTSFYLKVEPNLSRHVANKSEEGYDPDKGRIMLEYVKKWNWHAGKVRELDDFHNWSIEPVSRLLNSAKKFILQEYRRILGNIETHKIKHRFTDEEIKAISRKIYSHFQVADNKIDNTLSFKNYPPEKLLKIEYVRDQKGTETWFLSKRLIIDNHPNKVILHKDKTLLGLAVWISLNGLFKKDFTRLEIDTGLHSLETSFLRDLISDISANFMFKTINAFRENYLRDPYPVMSYLIFNLYSKYSRKIDEFFHLYHDSWGTTKFDVYKNEMELVPVLSRILNGCMLTRNDPESALKIVSSLPYGATKEFMRLKSFIYDLFSFFMSGQPDEKKIYVTMLGNQYVIFMIKKIEGASSVTTSLCDSEAKMLYTISFNYGLKCRIGVDATIKELNFLKTIVDAHAPGSIQIFFDSDRKYGYFYVLDETGSLFYFRAQAEHLFDYLTRLYLFARNAASTVSEHNQDSPLKKNPAAVEIYQLKKDLYMTYSASKIDPEHSVRIEEILKRIKPCTLWVTFDRNREPQYRISLPDGSPSSHFSKTNATEFMKKLVSLPESKEYRPYITSADLTALNHRYFTSYTSYGFYEKLRAELMLDNARKIIARGGR